MRFVAVPNVKSWGSLKKLEGTSTENNRTKNTGFEPSRQTASSIRRKTQNPTSSIKSSPMSAPISPKKSSFYFSTITNKKLTLSSP
jgi:hypothetical protein